MAIFHEPHYLASRVYTLSRKETHCMDKTLAIVLIGGLTASLQAFAGGGPPPAGIAPPKRIPLPAAAMSAGEPVNTAAVPPEVRRAVVADAARRFKVAENLVVLTGAERLTWKDGSLGCPEPGMSYTQALLPGYRMVAKSAAGALVYHTDSTGNLVLCDTHLQQTHHSDPRVAPKPVEPRTDPPPARTAPDR
jgi:hypothetical protein